MKRNFYEDALKLGLCLIDLTHIFVTVIFVVYRCIHSHAVDRFVTYLHPISDQPLSKIYHLGSAYLPLQAQEIQYDTEGKLSGRGCTMRTEDTLGSGHFL